MSSPDAPSSARQISVFVVEDEALVALNLEDMLVDLGFEVAASAMRLEQALDIVDRGCGADVAILDVNLAGKPVFPVAERLAQTGIPIVFATGYGRSGLPERWQANQVLQKPYTMEQIAGCLNAAVASGGAA
jgi:CheY-like chemotaxis protein